MKDILIVSNYCSEITEKGNGRFQFLCEKLTESGNPVELVVSDFNHSKKNREIHIASDLRFRVVPLHERGYSKNIGIKRIVSHYLWGRALKKYLKQRQKPDVVVCAVPPLTGANVAAKYCRKYGIRFVIDIQDLWPEAFQMVFRIPLVSNLLFAPFKRRANAIYKRADAICAVSERYVNRALSVNKKCSGGHAVFLGTSLQKFDRNVADIEPKISKPSDELWIGYCGSLAASYDIPCVLAALKRLQDEGFSALRFVVMGDGARREEFEKEASEAGIKAVFLGSLPYNQMCAQLVQCDIVVNPIVKGSAASIINKHGDYASSGKPVLNTQDSPDYRNLIDEYQMGLNCRNGDSSDLADKMKILIRNPALREQMGKNARRCAEERFDRDYTYRQLIDCILE